MRPRRVLREIAAVAVVVAVAVFTFALQWRRAQPRTGTGDSYWYLRSAARFAGVSPTAAAREAAQVYCADVERAHRLGSLAGGCTQYVVRGVSPRYEAIFTSRPGVPAVAAPLVAATGLSTGMLVTTALFFVLVALGTYAALRGSGAGRVGATVGGAIVCVLPVAYWDSRMLVEGAATAGTMFAVLGAFLLLERRRRAGVAVLTASLVWLFATKPATGAALCLLLIAAVAVVAARPGLRTLARRRSPGSAAPVPAGPSSEAASSRAASTRASRTSWRARAASLGGWVAIGATGVVVAGAWWILSLVLGLPGLTETVQDMATKHFRSPDVAHPLTYLLRHALSLWWHLPRVLFLPWPLVAALIAAAVIVLLDRRHALLWFAATLSAVLVVTAHPLRSEYPRLIAPVWILVAVALAVLTDRVVRRNAVPVSAPDGGSDRSDEPDRATGPADRGVHHPDEVDAPHR